jgi:hypothetical protein
MPDRSVDPVAVHVNRSSNFTLTAGTWTLVPWNAQLLVELAGVHSTSVNPSRLTVPTGYTLARFQARLTWPNFGGSRGMVVRQNAAGAWASGTGIAGDSRQTTNEGAQHCDTGWLIVTPGDYFELFARNPGDNGPLQYAGFPGGCSFMGEFLP